jgi:hypothetical protein
MHSLKQERAMNFSQVLFINDGPYESRYHDLRCRNVGVLQEPTAMTAAFVQDECRMKPHLQSFKKRVHFGNDDNDSVRTEVISIPSRFLEEGEDFQALWWDNANLAASKSESMRLAQKHSEENSAYQRSLLFLMKSYKKEYRNRQALLEHIRTIRQAGDVRGLEQSIMPVLKLYRTASSRTLLSLQEELRKKQYNPEMAATLLRQKSVQMSRGSRQLAFRLGQADHMEAKDIQSKKK